MYVALVPNRSSPPAYLLREGYREDGKVKGRTLANLSHWPLARYRPTFPYQAKCEFPNPEAVPQMCRAMPWRRRYVCRDQR
jgi:hypothetical protein